MLGPHADLLVTFPGTAKTSRPCSRAQRAVTRVPLYSAASITSTPTEMPLMMRLRIGKFCGAGNVPRGNSVRIAPPDAKNLVGELAIFLGINLINARAPNRDGGAMSVERSAMGGGIHSPCHATEYDESAGRKVAGQALSHARSVGRRMSRSNNCNSRLVNHFVRAPSGKARAADRRFPAAFGKLRVPRSKDCRTLFADVVIFSCRQLQRLSQRDALCCRCGKPSRLKLCERRTVKTLDAAEVFDQLAASARANSGRQGKG